MSLKYGKKYYSEAYGLALNNKKFYNVLNRLAEIQHWNFLKDCKKVLEVGCGIGVNIFGHNNATGVDVSKFAVKVCREKGIDAYVGDGHNLQFKNGSFGGIICTHVLEHMTNPLEGLKEIHRVLKKGGKLSIGLPTPLTKSRKCDQHLYLWSPTEIGNLLELVGFKIIDVKEYNFRAPLLSLYFPFEIWMIGSKLLGKMKKPNEFIVHAVKK